ncbi:hypothetical protein QAD02_023104 [Eretmocerus hayati]|uniref:Uncharacterized protein n=1 Tax=Eretmocerus hayati TaxID=131215 RepID=A0ACC2PUP7_9HYME|nr:hypothetical protein QAD02_023104 [Eretmocerus hayati]
MMKSSLIAIVFMCAFAMVKEISSAPQYSSNDSKDWHDKQSFVTSDGKGRGSIQAGQKISDNEFSNYWQREMSWESDGNYKPGSNDQVIGGYEEIERKQKELSEKFKSRMDDGMREFERKQQEIAEQFRSRMEENFRSNFGMDYDMGFKSGFPRFVSNMFLR